MKTIQKLKFQFSLKALLPGLACLLIGFESAHAQTAEKGPWWPHPIWGAGDQAGASNWITPEKILKSLSLVKTGKVYELGHVYEKGMPLVGERSYNLYIPGFPTHGPFGDKGVVFNDELLTAEIGQVGTQFDGPGHVGQQVKMADGTVTEVFYNGYTKKDIYSPYGLQKLGVENVNPYLTRGILIDIAGYKGVESLPQKYETTLDDVRNALKKQGMNEKDIEPGDALLFNFGWWRYWPKPNAIQSEITPFINADVVKWIIGRQPSMVGSDTNLDGTEMLTHTEITLKNGIFNLELMTFSGLAEDRVYEFLFVFTPLKIKGATGSPGRPLAIY